MAYVKCRCTATDGGCRRGVWGGGEEFRVCSDKLAG